MLRPCLLTFQMDFAFPCCKWKAEQNLPKLGPICTTSCRNYSNILACGYSYFLFPVQAQSFTQHVSGKRLYTHTFTHVMGCRVLNVWDKNRNFETKIKSNFRLPPQLTYFRGKMNFHIFLQECNKTKTSYCLSSPFNFESKI